MGQIGKPPFGKHSCTSCSLKQVLKLASNLPKNVYCMSKSRMSSKQGAHSSTLNMIMSLDEKANLHGASSTCLMKRALYRALMRDKYNMSFNV